MSITSSVVLEDLANVGAASGIVLLSCMKAEMFRLSGRHAEYSISGYINQHRWGNKLLVQSLSYVLRLFLIERYAIEGLRGRTR